MTTPEQNVADALRKVALRLEHALKTGRKSWQIDAEDLLETILGAADELDPPVPSPKRRKPPAAP